MQMLEANAHLRDGYAIRREGWGGYWMLCPISGKLMICLKTGEVLASSDCHRSDARIDWRETLTHMAAEDWEVCFPHLTLHWARWLHGNHTG